MSLIINSILLNHNKKHETRQKDNSTDRVFQSIDLKTEQTDLEVPASMTENESNTYISEGDTSLSKSKELCNFSNPNLSCQSALNRDDQDIESNNDEKCNSNNKNEKLKFNREILMLSNLNDITDIKTNENDKEVKETRVQPQSSLIASMANLILAVVGAGQLTLPYAVEEAGLFLGMVFLIGLYALIIYILSLMVHCLRETKTDCYGSMISKCVGYECGRFVNLFVSFNSWAGTMSYMVLIGGSLEILSDNYNWGLNRQILISIVVIGVVLPLSLLSSLDKLKFTSVTGAFAGFFITGVIVGTANWSSSGLTACANSQEYLDYVTENNISPVVSLNASAELQVWPKSLLGCIDAIPLIAFSFDSAWCFVNIFSEMKRNNDRKRVFALVVGTNSIILANYLVISIIGYLAYCSYTQPDILSNLGNITIGDVARFLLVLQLTFATPISIHVTRDILYKELRFLTDDNLTKTNWKKTLIYVTVTSILVGISFGIACLTDNVSVVLGFTSAFGASVVIYILPTWAYYKLQQHKGKTAYFAILVFLFGVFVFVAGITSLIVGLAGVEI